MENYEKELESLFLIATDKDKPDKEKIDSLFAISEIYLVARDFSNALKYAFIGASMTYSPRADICCQIGNIYTIMGNYDWAETWYRKAICNTSECDAAYTSIIPFQSLANMFFLTGNVDKSKEYAKMVLSIDNDNQEIKEMLNSLENNE